MIGYRRYSSQLELPEVTRANDRVGWGLIMPTEKKKRKDTWEASRSQKGSDQENEKRAR